MIREKKEKTKPATPTTTKPTKLTKQRTKKKCGKFATRRGTAFKWVRNSV